MELKRKYEAAMKEKTLAGLERDKMAAKVFKKAAAADHSWDPILSPVMLPVPSET